MWEFYGPPHNLLPDPQTVQEPQLSSGVSIYPYNDDDDDDEKVR